MLDSGANLFLIVAVITTIQQKTFSREKDVKFFDNASKNILQNIRGEKRADEDN